MTVQSPATCGSESSASGDKRSNSGVTVQSDPCTILVYPPSHPLTKRPAATKSPRCSETDRTPHHTTEVAHDRHSPPWPLRFSPSARLEYRPSCQPDVPSQSK